MSDIRRRRLPPPAPPGPPRHDPAAALARRARPARRHFHRRAGTGIRRAGGALASSSSACRRCSISRCRSCSTRCERLEPAYAAALLALNIVELAGLLYFTGGLQNPFSFLFLAPVLISATALPVRLDHRLGLLAVACASALFFFHLPLPWDSDEPLVLPPIYLVGVWLSIVVAIGVTSLYAFQVTEEARKLSDALGRDRTGADARAASDPARRPCRRGRARTRHAACRRSC